MVVCDGLGEHVGVSGDAVSNPSGGGVRGGQNTLYVDGHVEILRGTMQDIMARYQLPNQEVFRRRSLSGQRRASPAPARSGWWTVA